MSHFRVDDMSMINANAIANATAPCRSAAPRLQLGVMPSQVLRGAAAMVFATATTVLSTFAILAQQGTPTPQAPVTAPAAPTTAAPAPDATTPGAAVPSPPSPAIENWRQSLVSHLSRFERYPLAARGAQGVVTIAFRIDRQGNVVSDSIVKSSGSAVLDADALAMIKRAAPLPPPPVNIADDELSLVVPIRYAAAG